MTPRRVQKLRRTKREEVADYGVFRVERLTYESLPRDVYVYQCPDWCNVVAETDDGHLVMVFQYRYGTDEVSLEIPGGVIDPGEDPMAAARRELREETGYEAEHWELLSVVDPNPAFQGNKCWSFLARGAKKTTETAFDDLEDLELALVRTSKIPGLLDNCEIKHGLVVVALETWLRRRR